MMRRQSQQGVALLTILLMVVVATVLATSMILKQQRTLRETSMLMRQDQALQYALAGEAFAMGLLAKDSDTNSTDSLQDIWAQPLPPYPVEDGVVMARIEELSGRFNLNNLYHGGQADVNQMAYFQRLLEDLGISIEVAEAVLDWQDPDDDTTGNGGAEADFYASQQVIPANQSFQNLNELKQVRGVDLEVFNLLAPYVFVAPNFSQINVNTASAPVLTALADTLAEQDVANWVNQHRTATALDSVDDFFAVVPFSNMDKKARDAVKPLLSIQSSYFQTRVQVELSGRKRYLSSNIMRENKNTTAYQRQLSPFVQPAPKPTA